MNFQKTEPYLGIATIGVGILCLIQAYLHHVSIDSIWLQLFIATGSLWAIVYGSKIFLAYRNKELFFTTTLKWWNNFLYLSIAGYLTYLSYDQDYNSFTNFRSVIAFAFFLLSIATIKNYINLSSDDNIELSYQSVLVKWEDIIGIEKTVNGYGITTKDGRYAVLFETIRSSQLDDFKNLMDQKVKDFDDFSELQHLVDD